MKAFAVKDTFKFSKNALWYKKLMKMSRDQGLDSTKSNKIVFNSAKSSTSNIYAKEWKLIGSSMYSDSYLEKK